MDSWWSAVIDHPAASITAIVILLAATVAAGLGLRWISTRTRSLFHQVLAVTLASLAIGAAGAVVLARLMVVDGNELGTVLGVLATTAIFATLLVVVASKPLSRDIRRLEATVRNIETGDRKTSAGVDRADELGLVARALDDLTEQLDRLERDRDAYEAERTALLSSVSHDLRTPLAALQVSVEALADGIAPDPDRYLRSMNRDIQAISSLVDDLFLLSRIEHGDLALQPEVFDLAEIADEAIEALAPVAEARGLHVELAAAARVRAEGNATAIGRVIRNLLDNAIRHAPEQSTIVVSVSSDDDPTVRVVDQGPGFPAEFEAHAFDQFTRGGHEPESRDGRCRARPRHRKGIGRSPRWPDLDRAGSGRPGRVCHPRRLKEPVGTPARPDSGQSFEIVASFVSFRSELLGKFCCAPTPPNPNEPAPCSRLNPPFTPNQRPPFGSTLAPASPSRHERCADCCASAAVSRWITTRVVRWTEALRYALIRTWRGDSLSWIGMTTRSTTGSQNSTSASRRVMSMSADGWRQTATSGWSSFGSFRNVCSQQR